MPSGSATSRNCARCAINSEQVWWMVVDAARRTVRTVRPGSSDMAPPPVTSDRPMMLGPSRIGFPPEQQLHAVEQRPDAARPLVGHRLVTGEGEGEFLVLGADAEALARLFACGEPRDEFVARLDRRHIDLVTSHLGVSAPAKRARPYTGLLKAQLSGPDWYWRRRTTRTRTPPATRKHLRRGAELTLSGHDFARIAL